MGNDDTSCPQREHKTNADQSGGIPSIVPMCLLPESEFNVESSKRSVKGSFLVALISPLSIPHTVSLKGVASHILP